MDRERLQGKQAMLVLSILTEGPAHGYQVAKRLEERSFGDFCMKEGVLYPLLHSLEARGLATAHWEETERHRGRKIYTVTLEGKAWLQRQIALWKKEQAAITHVIGEAIFNVG